MAAVGFNNIQASLGIHQLVVLNGVFPSRDGTGDPDGIYMASIRSFAGNFAWGGTAFADGQTLAINYNQALFALLGTTFGGNGQTTFALPDLRDRTMVGASTLNGEGVKYGTETATLTGANVPAGGAQPFVNDQPSLTVNYFINAGGVLPNAATASTDVIGMVVPFLGNFAPKGYLYADGSTLNINSYSALFTQIGTTYGGDGQTTFKLPDLRGKTIIGDSPQHVPGSVVGQDQTIITQANLPASVGGSGTPIDNHQPSIALHYLIALDGAFPSRDGSSIPDSATAYIGETVAYAGTKIPKGWALANGQLLSIAQNQALFALLGTIYGGDGKTTFALPDLRNQTAIEPGTGPGLSPVYLGQQSGSDTITLTENNLPLPTVTINQAASQIDPSGPHPVRFDVLFSENVTGFTASDVILSGTAGATTKTVIPGIDAAHYSVSVSGMTQAGTVIASIIDKAATSVADGLPSKVSTSIDNTVSYFTQFAQPVIALGAFNPANGWTSQDQFPRHLADVTGDGNADIVAFGNGGVYVSQAAGDGTFGAFTVKLAAFNPANGWTSDNLFHREFADVSGDHRADIVGFGNGGVYVALAHTNNDGGFDAPTIPLAAFNPANGWTSQDQFPRQLADVNGDGKADIVAFGNGGVYVALAHSNGDGGFNAPTIVLNALNPGNGWTSQDSFPRLLGDVDGDGKADIVGFGNGGVYVSLATGNGNFAAPFIDIAAFNPANGWTSENQFPRLLADVNHDGKADIVAFGNGGVYVAYATGGGHFAAPVIDIAAFNPANGWTSDSQFHREVADINHDGFADIVGFGIPGVLAGLNYHLV